MNFTRTAGALILALATAFAGAAFASQETDLKACTSDQQTATLHLSLNDAYLKDHPDLTAKLQTAFTETAKGLSGADLQLSDPGYTTFEAKANKAAPGWIEALDLPLTAPPALTPGCK